MPNSKPLVSIIIPTYSRPNNLLRAINSALNQDYGDIEIIVVDDNGIDTPYQIETEIILRDLIDAKKIRYIKHQKNKNGSAARNTGFRASKGKYINFLDDDDEIPESKISSQVELLMNNQEYGASYTDTNIISAKRINKIRNPEETNDVSLILSGKCFFNTSTVLFRRTVIESLNGFDESFKRHQDYELYVRFFRKWKMRKSICPPIRKYNTLNVISNKPQQALEYLEYFLQRFSGDIKQSENSKKIYYYLYNRILILALSNRDYKITKYCLKKVASNQIPSPKMILRYIYYYLYPFFKR